MRHLLVLMLLLSLLPSVAHAEKIGIVVLHSGWSSETGGKAYPGDVNVPLVVEIQNPNPYDLRAMKLTLRYSKPFYLEYRKPGAVVRTYTQEKMLWGLKSNASATLVYSLSILRNAKPGVYLAELEVSYIEDPLKRAVVPLFLTLSGRPKLVVENVSLTPDVVYPGEVLKVEVVVGNEGNLPLREVEAELHLSPPFLPEAAGYRSYISEIESGEEQSLRFSIKIAGDAEAGGYMLPLRLSYLAEGKEVEKNISIGVTVAAPASFELAGITLSPVSEYLRGVPAVPCCTDVELEFDVVNTAKVEAASVEVEAEQGEGYQIHPVSVYIGTLNPDDFSTVRLTIRLEKGAGRVSVPFRILYTDENGRRASVEKQITVEESSITETKKERGGLISRFLRWLLGI